MVTYKNTIILSLFLGLMSPATAQVVGVSYYDCDYYKKSIVQLDSLRKNNNSINHSLEAGFSKVSITPSLNYPEDNVAEGQFKNVTLGGYSARRGESATDVHDSIFIRAAAIKVADVLKVIIGADLLLIPQNVTDLVLSMLRQDGISRDQLIFTATHSHSSIAGLSPGGSTTSGAYNENMMHWLVAQISLAVRTAVKDLKPALIGVGNMDAASYTRNRVIGELGTKNDDFSYIILEQIGGKKAVIGSFSAHATVLSAKNMEISGDYPGYWERKMERTFADYAIFCAGGVGSQSHSGGEGEDFERARKIGEALADIVLKCALTTPMKDKVVYSAITMKLNLPELSIQTQDNTSAGSQRTLPSFEGVVLQALRLNDMVWISAPADFSGEIALQIKNYLYPKGFNANVTSFNGSYVGYIIPSKYYYYDHYESKTMGWFGPNMGDYTADLIRQMSDIVIL